MQEATPVQRQNWEWRAKPYGLQSPFDVFTAARQYNLADADQITTPMLIADPEAEQFWPGQSQQLFDKLQGKSDWSHSPLTKAPTATASRWPDHFSNSACSTGSTKPSPPLRQAVLRKLSRDQLKMITATVRDQPHSTSNLSAPPRERFGEA